MFLKRSIVRRILAALAVTAVAFLPAAESALATHSTDLEKALRRKINAYRAENGKATLGMKDILVTKARAQAVRMAADGEFDQVGDHSTSAQLTNYAKAGKCDTGPGSSIQEIIASTTVFEGKNLDTIVDEWKKSFTHNSIMLKKKWEKIGTGVHVDSAGERWAVALFCSTK